jgi:hypothetical protein
MGYRQVYTTEARTVFRCCPGWSQQPGQQGCLSGECPHPFPPATLQTLKRGVSSGEHLLALALANIEYLPSGADLQLLH